MELAGRGTYERRLAAFAALVGRQLDFLAERLTDRDPVVRAYALRAARTLPLPDAAIEAAYEDASADARQRLSAVVLASGRTAPAERLVPRLREQWGDHAAAKLLPVCSARFVAAALPEPSYAVESWTKLGLGFPDQVLDHVERELADRPRAECDPTTGLLSAALITGTGPRRGARQVRTDSERQPPHGDDGPSSVPGLPPDTLARPGEHEANLAAHSPPGAVPGPRRRRLDPTAPEPRHPSGVPVPKAPPTLSPCHRTRRAR
ncbi:hypothetical protein ACFRK5_12930 [Streptomyces niveus]|uniref:hypothetical protein n=1 Tax=Streptomyces niveus TaxID=193462 RepID=UPI0036D1F285